MSIKSRILGCGTSFVVATFISVIFNGSIAHGYDYPKDDGRPVTVYAEKERHRYSRIDIPICKNKHHFFNAVIFVKYVDKSNNVLGYSNDFNFSVTGHDPYPNEVKGDELWYKWHKQWEKRKRASIYIDEPGNYSWVGPGPVNIDRVEDGGANCSPLSLNDRDKQEPAYAFTDGTASFPGASKYRLNCLASGYRYSDSFIFKMIGAPKDIPEGRTGRWLQTEYHALPYDYNPSGGDANWEVNDLNRSFMQIEFKYQVDLGEAPASTFSLTPNIQVDTKSVVDGNGANVKGITSRVKNDGPNSSNQSHATTSRFIVRKNARNEVIDTRLTEPGDSETSDAENAAKLYIESHFNGVDYVRLAHPDSQVYAPGNKVILDKGVDSLESELNIGDKVCYMTSIQQPLSTKSISDWSHSAPACIIVGFRPHVQVRGGDLLVGNRIITGTTSRKVDAEQRTYGSWSEYGAMAGGPISGFASGAAYRMGMQQGRSNLGFLTFSNLPDYGKFGPVSDGTSALAQYFSQLKESQTINGTDPVLDVGTLSQGRHIIRVTNNIQLQGALQDGVSVIIQIQPGKIVRIVGDITTPDASNSIDNLSQLVIAPTSATESNFNIHIAPNVTRVDAWMIAPKGRIDTCNAGLSLASRTAPYKKDGDEFSCHNTLTINGPVVAQAILLSRVGGQDKTAVGSSVQSIPAENFNLRPDAYLWIANQTNSANSRYITTHSADLPPRY